jgi:hypothetical protein
MKNSDLGKIGAAVCTGVLLVSALLLPLSGAIGVEKKININKPLPLGLREDDERSIRLDTYYVPEEEVSLIELQNDIGYNVDVGDNILRSLPIYVGEPVDPLVPGRGRTGKLDPAEGDTDDWYRFSACEGQTIQTSVSSNQDYGIEIADTSGNPVGQSYTADVTGRYFIHVFANSGAGTDEYTLSITLNGQNDAGTGNDAGDDIGSATSISPGSYSGYMDVNDQEDWYSFSASSGQGIFVTVEPIEKSDYDIHLYNPSGTLVHSALYYGEDTLEYPADDSGTWKIKLDIFPGWDESKWPDNYFLYGSGAYELEASVGGSAESPPAPVPQPDITPIAQTFVVNNQKTNSKDEFGYLAAVPAANYLEDGKRYLSPIVYQGEDYVPTWWTTVDQTTQYLLDDWDTYLARHGKTAEIYNIPSDPIQAAADIAKDKFESYNTAVIAVDGSGFEDEIEEVITKETTLNSQPSITSVKPGEFTFPLSEVSAYPMFLGSSWGAIHLVGKGASFSGDTGIITPRFEGIMEDWWPYPYDFKGEDKDTFFPITRPGIWMPYVTKETGLEELQIITYKGDRYTINVDDTATSLKVRIETDNPSNLIVYLADPEGNVRRPAVPHYNGGEIKPLHRWNGGHWEHDYDEFRTWMIEEHDDYEVEVHHPMKGKWTAIVVPYMDENFQDVGFNGGYTITATLRRHNPKRTAAELSAANAAVIASLKHAPLLYVTEDEVPPATQNALSGVSTKIFVNINSVSKADPGATTTYETMQQVIDAIKGEPSSENFITITSLASGDGYFAPAAMAAAYHGSPVLNFGEAPGAYDTMDKAATWREYGGDYYHGCRSLGHLPDHNEPLDIEEFTSWFDVIIYYLKHGQEFPPIGGDLKLTWMSRIHDGVYEMIDNYGLDRPGQEAYLFVGNRDYDLRDLICRAMMGTESYAGHIPVKTAAFSSAIIVRDLLYPAIIYANPGRDVTTSQMMNFPDGWSWTTNDGQRHTVYSSREIKKSYSSHGRFYEGHVIWDNLLERYNTGASICYYSGHGTGGSGISAQYYNVNDAFPYNELRHEHLKDFNWWDAWRGYMYDDLQTKTPRWGGFTWYNAKEPNLYDIIHFKWADQLFDNLHSLFDLWMSCTTQAHYGPIVYLSHGAALCFGNAGTGLCPQADLLDDNWMRDMMVNGDSIGESLSRYWWLHQRDYTAKPGSEEREKSLYGTSSMSVTNMQVIFADPTMTCYSPEWTEPTPINP